MFVAAGVQPFLTGPKSREVAEFLDDLIFCGHINSVGITYDPRKRQLTLAERGLDLSTPKRCFPEPRSRCWTTERTMASHVSRPMDCLVAGWWWWWGPRVARMAKASEWGSPLREESEC